MASRLRLNELLIKYSKHQVEWYNIGLQLGIEKHVLDIIKSDYQNKSLNCFCEMLTHWLKNDQSATEFRLQKEIKNAEITNFTPSTANQWHKVLYLAAIILFGIILVLLLMNLVIQYDNSPIKAAAETLKNKYRKHKVLKFNLHAPISDLEYLTVVMKDLSGHEFGPNELAQNYSGKTGRLIVTGQPGSGKTTLLRHLAREWANGRALQSCQILFLISLGSLEGKENSLSDLLSKSGFGDIVNLKEVSEKIYGTNGAGACFLLDAYDELKQNRHKFIDDIMEGDEIQSSFCLLTSRPLSREKLTEKQTQFEVIGYNIDNLSHYLHKLSDNATLISAVQHSWHSNTNVKQMCTLPLHMVMMLYIYHYESSVSIRTITQFYIAFMNVTIKYYERHHHEWNTESLWQCINAEGSHEDGLCSAFSILHQVAYDMVFKNQDLFSDIKDTKDYINQLSFVGVTSVPGSTSQVKFTFSHPTFLEFFAALHLTTLPLNEQLAFNTVYYWDSKFGNYRRCVEFYIGLIGDKFEHNTSGAAPLLKQLSLSPIVDTEGIHYFYNTVKRFTGWTSQQCGHSIDSALNINYSMCAYHSEDTCSVRSRVTFGLSFEPPFTSKYILVGSANLKLALMIEIPAIESTCPRILKDLLINHKPHITITLTHCLMEQDQKNLLYCIQRFDRKHCHGLRLPSVTSLIIDYNYPYINIFYQIKRALPNLKHIIVSYSYDWNHPMDYLLIDWNHNTITKELIKWHKISLALTNLRITLHLSIDIERCHVENETMPLYFNEINHVLLHITLTGMCHSNFIEYSCINVLDQLSIYVQDSDHTQSFINCIQQAQNLRELNLAYYEGAINRTKQKEIFKSLPPMLQVLKVCGFGLSVNTICSLFNEGGGVLRAASTLDVKLVVDALIERKNLHTLMLSISNVEDMKILTQLTFLVHLHIVLDYSLGSDSVDKGTMLSIVRNLQHFPLLESFKLTANCSGWSDYDKQEVLSTIFAITPARDIQIFSCSLSSQFEFIITRHINGIKLLYKNITCSIK